MKNFAAFLFALILLISCGANKKLQENLPIDIAMRPLKDSLLISRKDSITANNNVARAESSRQRRDSLVSVERLNQLKQQIDSLISTKTCTDASQWRISPLGAKPCGGPSSYIAYPKELEESILPKITMYNLQNSEYNRQNRLISDCSVIESPSGIQCENGKAVLLYGSRTADAVPAE